MNTFRAGLEAIAFPKTELEELVHTLLIVRPNITKIENLRRQKGCFNRNRSAGKLIQLIISQVIYCT